MSPLYLYNGKLLLKDTKLAAASSCCCEKGKCLQVPILGPSGTGFQNNEWPGLEISISGPVSYYGTYDGVPNGFWQGPSSSGTASTAVTLTFTQKKPVKIVVLSSAMNTGENHNYQIIGTAASAILDLPRPSGAYRAGSYSGTSDIIERADPPGLGDSHFRFTVLEASSNSLEGFVWGHDSPKNQNGMVVAIFLCSAEDQEVNFV